MSYSQSATPVDAAFHLGDGVRKVTAHITAFADGVPFGSQFAMMGGALSAYLEHLLGLDRRLYPNARNEEARRALPTASSPTKAAIAAVQEEGRAIAEADRRRHQEQHAAVGRAEEPLRSLLLLGLSVGERPQQTFEWVLS